LVLFTIIENQTISVNIKSPKFQKTTFAAVKTRRYLKHLSASISLVILALGFSLLGLLTFTGRNRDGVIDTLSLENTSAIVGSLISILIGASFLVAASVFWSRYSRRMD
jgi:hypothetical protein